MAVVDKNGCHICDIKKYDNCTKQDTALFNLIKEAYPEAEECNEVYRKFHKKFFND